MSELQPSKKGAAADDSTLPSWQLAQWSLRPRALDLAPGGRRQVVAGGHNATGNTERGRDL